MSKEKNNLSQMNINWYITPYDKLLANAYN